METFVKLFTSTKNVRARSLRGEDTSMRSEIEPPVCAEQQLPEVGDFGPDRVAQVSKALGHPARVRIVAQFEQDEPHFAQEIVGGCDLAQSTVSEHLRILREADVLHTIKDGPRTWYCLRRAVLRAYARAVEDLVWGTSGRS